MVVSEWSLSLYILGVAKRAEPAGATRQNRQKKQARVEFWTCQNLKARQTRPVGPADFGGTGRAGTIFFEKRNRPQHSTAALLLSSLSHSHTLISSLDFSVLTSHQKGRIQSSSYHAGSSPTPQVLPSSLDSCRSCCACSLGSSRRTACSLRRRLTTHSTRRRSVRRPTPTTDDRQRFFCSRGTYKMFSRKESLDNMEISDGYLPSQTQDEAEDETDETVNKRKRQQHLTFGDTSKKLQQERMG
ncbi:hypothetical protein PIB30_009587 [Stylosanthes scabra]|uniref:Uncharacterized protein n=1 Tax=Stylosanthes scabra TaxID=79078 RepID=A0ABU6R5T8_9FABA|nr:hypothetical protein [Stylosanthes scabra]